LSAVSTARPATPIEPAEWIWLSAALLVGAVLAFWGLADKSPTPDEEFYYFESIAPIPQLVHITVYDNFHPPLFYLIFHAVNAALHLPESGLRYFTAAFHLLTILATWGLARRWFGAAPAAIAAIVVAVEPLLVAEARLFRMYAVATALATAAWWLLAVAQEKQGAARRWLWLAYGALALAMPYLLYLASFVVAAQALYGIVNWRSARPAFFWALAAGAATVPWWWAVRIQMPGGAFPNAMIDGWRLATDVLLSTPPDAWRTPAVYASVTLLAVAIIVAGSWLARSTALPFMFIPLALQVVLSVVLHKDLLVHRYLALSVPAFVLALTSCIAALAVTRARLVAAAMIVAVLGSSAVALADVMVDPYYQTTDWYAIEIALHEHSAPSDALVFDQWGPTLVLQGSPDVRGHDVYRISRSSPPESAIEWIDEHPAARIWYVENLVDAWDPQRIVAAHLRASRRLLYSLTQSHAAAGDDVLLQLYGSRGH
jgi:4-amino-4-deoxy-L-arabinose transferase-like glycosyltransferase